MRLRLPAQLNRRVVRRQPHRLPARIALVAAKALLGFYLGCAVLLIAYRWINPPLTSVQLQRCLGSAFSGFSLCGRPHFVRLEEMAAALPRAVIAAEDARFYQHHGIDWKALGDAIEDNRRGRRIRGGSTITQQLVKNLFLTTHSVWLRKAIETPLALLADRILPKRRILELYLNVIEWGPGIYGAEQAARFHYARSSRDLTRVQAARLAAVLPSPQRRRPERMQRYSDLILRRMK